MSCLTGIAARTSSETGKPVKIADLLAEEQAAAAAITTTGLGCVTPVPRLKEIEAFVARQPR